MILGASPKPDRSAFVCANAGIDDIGGTCFCRSQTFRVVKTKNWGRAEHVPPRFRRRSAASFTVSF